MLSLTPTFARSTEQRQTALRQALFPTHDSVSQHAAWIGNKTRQLVKDHSFKLFGVAGSRLDIVGNVVNLAPVYWVAEFIVRFAFCVRCLVRLVCAWC